MSSPELLRTALYDLCSGFQAMRPPKRMTVAEGAAKNLRIKQTGETPKAWDASETPYMVQPMNAWASRHHEAGVFVGPARTGKTAGLLLGGIAHTVVNDPGDMLFIQMSKEKAREFSKTDVSRALEHSPNIAAMKTGRVVDENTFDTMFRHGMWLRIAWPTISNVSGSTYRFGAVTDYDRIENADNVDGEGTLFDQLRKRTQTFLSRGMVYVESSPGKPVEDPHWTPVTRHEAPPVKGILSIYNLSDRHRWYWPCLECHTYFEAAPGLGLFRMPPDRELMSDIRSISIPAMVQEWGSRIICPHCDAPMSSKWKTDLNASGIWVPDGVDVDEFGLFHGAPLQSKITGYWLGGVAAAYQSWRSLVERYLEGLRTYALTGSEETLKTTVTLDQGMPYTERRLIEMRSSARTPRDKAVVGLERFICPPETRCVVVSVDVQGGQNAHFSVQAHAIGPYMEQWCIDRKALRWSKRPGMGTEFAPIDPARYPEDWDVLTDLLRSTYRLPDGREIRIKAMIVDSGGEGRKGGGEGVTHNAVAWFRRIRKLNVHARVRLYKGASLKTAPLLRETLIGARRPGEKGDVPQLLCNPNLLADAVDAGLKRDAPGPGYIHLPAVKHPVLNPAGWVDEAFFDELNAEVRGDNGVWTQIRKRNETFDHCKMVRAGMIYLGLDKVLDWSKVPDWLKPLAENSETITPEDRRAMQANVQVAQDPSLDQPREPRGQRQRRFSVAAL